MLFRDLFIKSADDGMLSSARRTKFQDRPLFASYAPFGTLTAKVGKRKPGGFIQHLEYQWCSLEDISVRSRVPQAILDYTTEGRWSLRERSVTDWTTPTFRRDRNGRLTYKQNAFYDLYFENPGDRTMMRLYGITGVHRN